VAGAPVTGDEALLALFERCSNWGRWGQDDELGTLNYITPEVRRRAASEVREGRTVSLARELSKHETPDNPRPIVHFMAYEAHHPHAALDFVGLIPHGLSVTHLDALGHCFFDDMVYNGRPATRVVSKPEGLQYASILAQREGIVTRGVLLDVAAARGVGWLAAGEYVTAEDLEAAADAAGGVEPGDAVCVHLGLEAREAAEGPEDRSLRAGLDAGAVGWLHDRRVSLYTGDCIERMPYPSDRMPVPLHQIGLVAMGLVLLDSPRLAPLVACCRELGRSTFFFTVAPLLVPGGTGSPVNPLAVF
jgi:kynurenine formamidase